MEHLSALHWGVSPQTALCEKREEGKHFRTRGLNYSSARRVRLKANKSTRLGLPVLSAIHRFDPIAACPDGEADWMANADGQQSVRPPRACHVGEEDFLAKPSRWNLIHHPDKPDGVLLLRHSLLAMQSHSPSTRGGWGLTHFDGRFLRKCSS